MIRYSKLHSLLNQYKWDSYALYTLYTTNSQNKIDQTIAKELVILKYNGVLKYRWSNRALARRHPTRMYALEHLGLINVYKEKDHMERFSTSSAKCHLTKLGREYVDYAFPSYPDGHIFKDDSKTNIKPRLKNHMHNLHLPLIEILLFVSITTFIVQLILMAHKVTGSILLIPVTIQTLLMFLSNTDDLVGFNPTNETVSPNEVRISSILDLDQGVIDDKGHMTKGDFIAFMNNHHQGAKLENENFNYIENILNQMMFSSSNS